ncbi:hypothetical protein K501DRAFT_44832 [Backusella circina FSU 941]|nr:hypothetical protein K501DRAFT_44832 [Backusella circina FSU 941]
MTSTKWWWKKQPKTSSTKSTAVLPTSSAKSITSNGADENASMLSLYSCTERGGRDADSVFAHSYVASSTRAQHTRSEYSGNFSDIESNTSILSKPWISRNLASNIPSSPESSDDTSSIASHQRSSLVDDTTTNDILLLQEQPHNQKRRGSLVDYFTVNKPLQGKLKAGFGKLIRNQTNDTQQQQHPTTARRKSYS